MNANNKVIRATAIVFGFWWLLLTARAFGGSPMEFLENWPLVGYNVSHWILGVVSGLFIGIWFIWFTRLSALNKLYAGKKGNILNGARSTLGKVPMPTSALPRIEVPSKRLPIDSKKVLAWVEANEKKWPAHVAFFWAIWDTYSAHAHFPASHRKGGHGNRRLWEHCLAVADTALEDAGAYVFDGVYVKARGKPKFKIIDLKNKEYRFDATDPLIPILGLAHDIGKLEAYELLPDGSVKTQEEGGALTPQDDNRISHDALGARILARFPEFWALPARDRQAVNLVIAHYHHPSDFPVDRNGLSLDDRMTALMEFLILVDKKTGMAESSITETLSDHEISEDESNAIYHSFVEIMTEYGRVNGTGDQAKDSTLKIAQKHDGLIVIREKDLRSLILAKMGWSLEEGDGRYRMTLNLMTTLQEKGLLYSRHNHADMSRFLPMYSISLRNAQTGAHLTTWEPCIIVVPVATTPELAGLSGLPNMGTKLDIERPLFTHNLGITEADALREIVTRGFSAEIAAKMNIAGKQEEKPKPQPAPAPAPAPQAQAEEGFSQPAADTVSVPQPNAPTVDSTEHATSLAGAASGESEHSDVPGTQPDMSAEALLAQDDDDPLMSGGADDELLDEDLQSLTLSSFGPGQEVELVEDFLAIEPAHSASDDVDDVDDVFGAFALSESPNVDKAEQSVNSTAGEEGPGASLIHNDDDLGVPAPAPMAVAIPDPDATPTKRISPAAESAALRALEEAGANFTAFVAPRKKKPGPAEQLEGIRAAVKAAEIPICGTKDGFDYVLESDLMVYDPKLKMGPLIRAEKLPTVEPKPGVVMVGIPVAPMQLDL